MSDPEPAVSVSGLSVTGHGFGHGRGLSQYGAYGAALRGVKAAQILSFYYPGTTPATLSQEIRVLISADNDDDLVVHPAAGLAIADYGAGKAYKLPLNGARLWKLFTSEGLTKVSYLSDTGWKRYALGGKSALAGVGEFRSSSFKLTLRTPAGDRKYRGALRYINANTVNRLSMESYLQGVVPVEMPASWRLEALKAQSVAARSYSAREIVDHPTQSFHVYDDTRDQVYGGLGVEEARSTEAVAATAGSVLMYNGIPALTQFSSSNGGWLAPGDTQAYLVGKQDKFEQYSPNPNRRWTVTVTATMRQNLVNVAASKFGTAIGTLQKVQVINRDGFGEWGGRVRDIKLIGSAASVTIGGSDFRGALGLKSTYFTLVP